jgi:hypothetical protein
MKGSDLTAVDRDRFLAELTNAAYSVALRYQRPGSWIDLELDIWKALGATVQQWQPNVAPGRQPAWTGR